MGMESLTKVLLTNFSELVTDPFGNYVLQHLLEFGRTEDRLALIHLIRPRLEEYSGNRCASNLVEKALRFEEDLVLCGKAEASTIVQRILRNAPLPLRELAAIRIREDRALLEHGP